MIQICLDKFCYGITTKKETKGFTATGRVLNLLYIERGGALIRCLTHAQNNVSSTKEVEVYEKQFCFLEPADSEYLADFSAGTCYIHAEFAVPEGEKFFTELLTDEYFKTLPRIEKFTGEIKGAAVFTDTQNVYFALNRLSAYINDPSANEFTPFTLYLDLLGLAVEILKCYKNSLLSAERDIYLRKALAYINTNFHSRITVKSVCDNVGVSVTYLNNLFRKNMKNTIHGIITGIRIERSAILLGKSNFSISKISKSVGFLNVQTYIKNFKCLTGITPNEFRKRHLFNIPPENRV